MSVQNPDLELVVDTDVVVKFFIDESDSDKADILLEGALLGKIGLVALDFLFIEFVNVLWIKTRRGELTETEAREKITQLIALSSLMEIVPSRGILPCFSPIGRPELFWRQASTANIA
jgi:predicted nucleic acid-binding protein